jgi:phosphomannomutase
MFFKIVLTGDVLQKSRQYHYLSTLAGIWGVDETKAADLLKKKILKPTGYDIRANVKDVVKDGVVKDKTYLTPAVMEIIGHAFAATPFVLKDGQEVFLREGDWLVGGYDTGETSKDLAKAFFKGVKKAGVNVYDIGMASSGQVAYGQYDLRARAHVMITRSHVEVEINGAKFQIDLQGIHTYILEQMQKFILEDAAVTVPARKGITVRSATIAMKTYEQRMLHQYGDVMKNNTIPVAINAFHGTATKYLPLFQRLLGKNMVKAFGENATFGSNTLLSDPTRPEMLDAIGATEYSKQNPDVLVFSNDLDSDRQSMSQNGKLYLGDEIGMLLAKYKFEKAIPELMKKLEAQGRLNDANRQSVLDIVRTVYIDNRCKKELGDLVVSYNGIKKSHTKGHSLWKETINANMAQLAKLTGFATVEDLVKATGYRDAQIEYSLHMFVTGTQDGIPRDDGIENVFYLTHVLNEMGIKDLDRDFFGPMSMGPITKEIRTGVASDTKDLFTEAVNSVLLEFFTGTGNSFEIDKQFAGQVRVDFTKPEGKGFVMYSCSNTSPKVGFMVQGSTVDLRNNLLAFLLGIHNYMRNADELMDLKENAFFKTDDSYAMSNPDLIDISMDPRVEAACAYFGISLDRLIQILVRKKLEYNEKKKVYASSSTGSNSGNSQGQKK